MTPPATTDPVARRRERAISAAVMAFRALDGAARVEFFRRLADDVRAGNPILPVITPPAPAPPAPALAEMSKGRPYAIYTLEHFQRVMVLRAKGMSQVEIAKQTGIHESAVKRMCTRRPPFDRMALPPSVLPAAPAAPKPPAKVAPAPKSAPPPERPRRASTPPPAPVAKRAAGRARSPKAHARARGDLVLSDSEDSSQTYLRRIGGHRLLTGDEERALAAELEDVELQCWRALLGGPGREIARQVIRELRADEVDGDQDVPRKACMDLETAVGTDLEKAARTIRRHDVFRKYIEAALGRVSAKVAARVRPLAQRAIAIRNTFITCNLKLVVKIVGTYRYTFPSISMIDLIQEGNLGLIRAVPQFDHRRGLRFSTFATYWIRHAIGRAVVDKANTVRIPAHMFEVASRVRKHYAELFRLHERPPTEDELATATQVHVRKVRKLLALVPHIVFGGTPTESLDEPLERRGSSSTGGEGEEPKIGRFLDPSRDATTHADELADRELGAHLERYIAKLPAHMAEIIRHRFGIGDVTELTLKELGDSSDLSRERIRQLQTAALTRLRNMMIADGVDAEVLQMTPPAEALDAPAPAPRELAAAAAAS